MQFILSKLDVNILNVLELEFLSTIQGYFCSYGNGDVFDIGLDGELNNIVGFRTPLNVVKSVVGLDVLAVGDFDCDLGFCQDLQADALILQF